MRDLAIDTDIAQIIGEARAQKLRTGPHPARIRCHYCRRFEHLDTGAPVTAGVDVHPNGIRVWFLHRRCGRPQIVRIPTPYTAPEETFSHAICYGGYGPDGLWACVLVELVSTLLVVHPGQPDSDVDQVLSVLTAGGMQPAADPLCPPAPDTITWRVQLPRDADHRGGIYGRRRTGGRFELHEPMPPIPPRWLQMVAARGGQCGLYVASRTDLATRTVPDLAEALAAAGRDGQVVATTAAVTR